MAKRKAEVEDEGEQRAVFVDTSLNTHLVLLVSPTDTFSLLKEKILLEHPKCFPELGEIKINALKVKRRGCYYHLLDSMLVRTAFYGIAKNWFLLADVSSQIACYLTTSNDHAIIVTEPSKALPPIVASSKHLESRINQNEENHFENHSSDADKMLGLEVPNKFDLSRIQNECKLVEETLNAGDLQDISEKKTKKKRKRTIENDNVGDENGERLESVHIDLMRKETLSAENTVRNVGNDLKPTNNVADKASPSARAKKKHKGVIEGAQETSLSKANSFISDFNRVDPKSEAVVSKSDQGDTLRSESVDVNGLPSSTTSKGIKKRKKEKRHASSEIPSSKANGKKNLIHREDLAYNASDSATDAVAKVGSLRVERKSSALLLEGGDNNLARDVQEGTDYQAEGIHTSIDKLVNNETENNEIALVSESRAKKAKKSKKGHVDGVNKSSCPIEMPDTPKHGCAPTQNENDIHAQENSVTESVEHETRTKKKKVKKGKMSTKERTELSSMEHNQDTAHCAVSNGRVKNNSHFDFTVKSDREDDTHKSDKKRDKTVKTSSISSRNGDQEADDTGKLGAEPLHTSEINKPDASVKIRGEKAKRKTQKKQTVSVTATPEVSVKEQSDEKMTETDIHETGNVDLLINGDVDGSKNLIKLAGDLHEDADKTSPIEVSADATKVRKTDRPLASKQKVKRDDWPSSVDTSCSGHNTTTSKKSRGRERTSLDGTKFNDDDGEAECIGRISAEREQPLPINKDEENMEITGDNPTENKQIALKDPPESPMKQQLDEKTRKIAVSNSADGDLLANTVKDANHQSGSSLEEDHDKNYGDIRPLDSAGSAEGRNQDKSHTSREDVKKPNQPSSMDTSSNQPCLSKLKKSKESKRTCQNGTQLQESATEQHLDILLTQPSERHCGAPKEGIEPQAPYADPNNSGTNVAHNRNAGARKKGVASASLHDGSKLPGASNMSSPVKKTHQGKKAKESQKKQDENHIGFKTSLKNMGEVVNGSPQKKGLLVTTGAIFEDESSASSDDGDKMKGSDSSTRTPSDNLSSSDYSEGESKGDVVTSTHDASKGGGQDGTNPNSSGLKNMTLHSILRSSSRYRKAKVVASQSQLEDSEPVDVVPDSQANL